MHLIIDSHVHFYPFYDSLKWYESALRNLSGTLPATEGEERILMVFLTERSDCRFFRVLTQSEIFRKELGCEVQLSRDGAAIIRKDNHPDLMVIPGRQIVTTERIELIALTTDVEIPDQLPTAQALKRIKFSEGIPCLSWSPFKWTFNRARIIQEILDGHEPGELVFSDSSLRCTGMWYPSILRQARSRGFTILAGTDPLPFPGEETIVGRYRVHYSGDFDTTNPLTSVRQLLKNPKTLFVPVGDRSNPCSAARRLLLNQIARQ